MTTSTTLEHALPERDTGESLRLWTRREYYQAASLGWFNGERVELIRGEVYRKLTQNPPHATSLNLIAKALEKAIGQQMHVRQQLPLPVLNDSDPEPDLLVVHGMALDYAERHPYPAEAVLVIEVSDTTLQYDRKKKGCLYAQAGLTDYWIVNLNSRTLEVYRDPVTTDVERAEATYRTTLTFDEEALVTPLALPQVNLRVADLLPPGKQGRQPEGPQS